MAYTKPTVNIDLEEYNDLLKAKDQNKSNFNDEDFTEFANEIIEAYRSNALKRGKLETKNLLIRINENQFSGYYDFSVIKKEA